MADSGKSITFGSRWGAKSYKVTYSGKYHNSREPHVETPETGLTGKKVTLGARRVKTMGQNVAVMYDVPGVKNGAHVAHFTAYFGSPVNANEY